MSIGNKFLVGFGGNKIAIMTPPTHLRMTPNDALILAAWLVAIAEPLATEKFDDILQQIKNT